MSWRVLRAGCLDLVQQAGELGLVVFARVCVERGAPPVEGLRVHGHADYGAEDVFVRFAVVLGELGDLVRRGGEQRGDVLDIARGVAGAL